MSHPPAHKKVDALLKRYGHALPVAAVIIGFAIFLINETVRDDLRDSRSELTVAGDILQLRRDSDETRRELEDLEVDVKYGNSVLKSWFDMRLVQRKLMQARYSLGAISYFLEKGDTPDNQWKAVTQMAEDLNKLDMESLKLNATAQVVGDLHLKTEQLSFRVAIYGDKVVTDARARLDQLQKRYYVWRWISIALYLLLATIAIIGRVVGDGKLGADASQSIG